MFKRLLLLILVAVVIIPLHTTVAAPAKPDLDWFRNTTVYSLYVRSFRDSNGDAIGDLQGVIDGLDYLQSLGIETLWLLPIFKSPSVHGYDVTDYEAVNPDYGTVDDLIRLNRAVHRRGMHILLDLPLNHTSNQHPFFKDAYGNPNSVYSDYYVWTNDAHTQYQTFQGYGELPKLNYDSDKAVAYMTGIALYWLDPLKNGDFAAGIDGYRLDAAKYVFRTVIKHIRAEMTALNPHTVLLGEVWYETPQDIANFLGEDRLDAAFDFPLFYKMAGFDSRNGAGVLSGKGDFGIAFGLLRATASYYPPGAILARFLDSHDTNRLMSNLGGDMERARAAAVYLLSVPGVPVVYYGEEIGMKGERCGPPDYDACRREPLKWYAGLSGKGQTAWFRFYNQPGDGISIEEQDGKPDSLLTLYRRLGTLRREDAAMHGADTDVLNLPGDLSSLYVLRRWQVNELIVIAINFSTTSIDWKPDAATWKAGDVSFNPGSGTELFQQNAQIASDGSDWSIQPAGFMIWKLGR